MKIAILSDVHLGFGRGTEREGDAYEALAEALEKSQDCDLVLVAGDMFDSSSPSAEVLALSEEILLLFLLPEGGVRISDGMGKDTGKLKLVNPRGRPVIAIHGTHERRAKGLLNPVQALEKAGFMVYLHCNGVVVEKDGERVCVQGMSGVPDQYAGRVLDEWNPRPREGCYNILLVHQNLKGFMHEMVPNQLDPERLNRGFDLYVCGHMHDSRESELGGSRLIVPGGMVATQLREGEKELGFYVLDTETGRAGFARLESQRRVYFLEAGSRQEAEKKIKGVLAEKHERKPIIRLALKGGLPARELRQGFGDRAILKLKSDSGEEAPEAGAVSLEEQRLSVRELGKRLLRDNLKRQGLEPDVFEQVFELLLEKREGKALELLKGRVAGKPETPEAGKPEGKGAKKRKREDSGEWKGKGELGKFFA